MPGSSGTSIRMFPLTSEGDWTAAASACWGGGMNRVTDFTRLQMDCFKATDSHAEFNRYETNTFITVDISAFRVIGTV